MFAAELLQHSRQRLQPAVGKYAEQLPLGRCRVGERPEQVEYGAHAEFLAHGGDMAHGGVELRRHEEADIGLLERALQRGNACGEVDAELAQHVGGAAWRRHAAIAVLDHRHTAGRDHEGHRGGNVERALGVAAGAAGVDGAFGGAELRRFQAQHFGPGGDFIHRLALDAQGQQECTHLRRGRARVHDDLERARRLLAAKVAAFGENGEDLLDGVGAHIPSRKFLSSWWPCCEAMLSGWNCTPCVLWVLCDRPMMIPSPVSAVISKQSGRLARSTISEW